jgi:hypothetical protein
MVSFIVIISKALLSLSLTLDSEEEEDIQILQKTHRKSMRMLRNEKELLLARVEIEKLRKYGLDVFATVMQANSPMD